MTSINNTILIRLHRIEVRLDRLEARAGLAHSETGPAPIEPPAPVAAPAPEFHPEALLSAEAMPDQPGPLDAALTTAVAPPAPRRRLPGAERDEETPGLERIIGGRWYAILGGLVVIIGVAFFYQYAVQQGWFRILPDWLKCAGGAAFGAALLAGAEVIRKRINAWAAVGLSSAGIGTMYVSTFSAYERYDLFSTTPAFILLSACAALGIIFAVRARLVAVALVSLIGGYLTPLLLHDSGRSYILPPYWAMLLMIGLALSARLGGSFRFVRWLVCFATLVFGAGWTLADGAQYPYLAIAFLAFTWLALHAELWWSSSRPRELPRFDGIPEEWRDWSPIITSFMTTTWTVALGVLHARAWGQVPDWLPPAAASVVTAMISLILAGNLRVLRDAPANGTERLGAGLCAQAGGLVIAATALALSGWLEVVAWLGMGVAGVLAGRWLDARPLRFYGALLLTIATARLLVYDSQFGGMTSGATDAFHGLVLSRWMLLMMIAAAAWLSAAIFAAIDSPSPDDAPSRRPTIPALRFRIPAALLAGIAVTLLSCSFIHSQASPSAITIAWMAIAAVLIPMNSLLRSTGQARLASRLHLTPIAAGPALVAIIPWSLAFIARGWSDFNDPPGLHRGLIIAILLAVELAWAAWAIMPARADDPDSAVPDAADRRAALRGCALGLGAILLFAATSFEAARIAGLLFTDRTSQLAAVSIWWGLFSIALLIVGFLPAITGRAEPHTPRHTLGKLPRQAGLALLGLATAKALFMDTAQVSLGWRVISVLGLGLLMLGVGVVYARLTGRERLRST
ncbi:MAG: DUF2339 domain-containing protein [Phycisphaerales bacterium]|nr:DUF2339 domain-containing protein [Phycisphaerales bacterium]